MELITEEIKKQLLKNGKIAAAGRGEDADAENQMPVVKLFHPALPYTWLISEMMQDENTLFGLYDLGFGAPEVGYTALSEIKSIPEYFFLRVERDLHFKAKKKVYEYAEDARAAGRIVT